MIAEDEGLVFRLSKKPSSSDCVEVFHFTWFALWFLRIHFLHNLDRYDTKYRPNFVCTNIAQGSISPYTHYVTIQPKPNHCTESYWMIVMV